MKLINDRERGYGHVYIDKKKMMIEMEGNEIQCYYNPFLFELVK